MAPTSIAFQGAFGSVESASGGRQVVCYVGILRGFRRLKEASADANINNFLQKYLAVVMQHAISSPQGLDVNSYKEEVLMRFRSSDEELRDLATNGTESIENCCH